MDNTKIIISKIQNNKILRLRITDWVKAFIYFSKGYYPTYKTMLNYINFEDTIFYADDLDFVKLNGVMQDLAKIA